MLCTDSLTFQITPDTLYTGTDRPETRIGTEEKPLDTMIIPPDSSEASSSTHTTYRIKRGTKLAVSRATLTHSSHDLLGKSEAERQDIPHYSSGSNVSLANFDGPFQLSEYLALKVRSDPHDAGGLVDVPKGDSVSGNKAPERDVVSPPPALPCLEMFRLSVGAVLISSGSTNI